MNGGLEVNSKLRKLTECFFPILILSAFLIPYSNVLGESTFSPQIKAETLLSIVEKANEIQQIHDFSFSLVDHANKMVIVNQMDVSGVLLTDLNPPLPLDLPDIYFKDIGRNESCPCGSGKKYKRCCINVIQFPGKKASEENNSSSPLDPISLEKSIYRINPSTL